MKELFRYRSNGFMFEDFFILRNSDSLCCRLLCSDLLLCLYCVLLWNYIFLSAIGAERPISMHLLFTRGT